MNIYIPSSYISFYYIVNSSHLCVNKHLVDFQLFFYLCILAVICAYSQPSVRTRSHLHVLAVICAYSQSFFFSFSPSLFSFFSFTLAHFLKNLNQWITSVWIRIANSWIKQININENVDVERL